MSTHLDSDEYDPVANLHMQPAKGILKTTRSTDDPKQDNPPVVTQLAATASSSSSGMTRSESKSHKIPHFDEMNIIATYHPADKDYGHMKIEEPKTPYAPNDVIDEELSSEPAATSGIDPTALAQRLKETAVPSATSPRFQSDHRARKSIDDETSDTSNQTEHRKDFENHRKKHYNEFEVVRMHKKEIEAELRALEEEESATAPEEKGNNNRISSSRSSVDSIKPILVHPHSRDSSSSSGHHHVHVIEDEHEHALTAEEQERKKQFELKRKKHYNEFRAARLADKDDDDPQQTG